MENSSFIISLAIAIIYISSKLLENKYMDTEMKPLKDLVRDTLIVYISSVIGIYGIEQLSSSFNLKNTQIFTGNPEF